MLEHRLNAGGGDVPQLAAPLKRLYCDVRWSMSQWGWLISIVMVLSALSAPVPVDAQVLITEIMYNPASSERFPNDVEWVEIYNAGDEAVNVGGCCLADEDGRTAPLPADVKLGPRQALVLVPGMQTPEHFHAAWGPEIVVVPLGQWGLPGKFNLSNDPSPQNEILTLRDAANTVVDEVNFDDEGDWPSDVPPGPSIYLLPGKLNAQDNDAGTSWARSAAGKDGGRTNRLTGEFDGVDTGSPGVVVRDSGGQ
jgi:hypothetical protein